MSRPTDVELMMYFDGELEAERHDAVAKFLAESSEASKKVRGLGIAAAMIALRASRSNAADGVGDAVMAAIAKEPTKAGAPTKDQPSDIELMMYFDDELETERREVVEAHLASSRVAAAKVRALGVGSEMLARHASRSSAAADPIADAVMAVVAEEAAKQDELGVAPQAKVGPKSKRPPLAANDNARTIYVTALLAVAAAAALLVWGRGGADTMPTATPTPSADVASSAAVAAVTAPAAAPSPSAPGSAAEDEGEPEAVHGVEVAAVEFGGRMGSIFYVPSGDTGSGNMTTTVVWLADDAGEE